MGQKNGLTVFASETCGLDILQADYVRDVEPGEIVRIDLRGLNSFRYAKPGKKAHCIFELIYFARPDSVVFGHPVHSVRKKMGEMLASINKSEADIVCSVPDSGNSAALGFAASSGLPLEQGLTRNHYSGRTFIQPTTEQREFAVKMKLHPIRSCIQNKTIVLIDDSLVRGTTSKTIVRLLKDAGAKGIHFRLTAPEIKHPCYFGIDIPTSDELISNRMTPEQIAEFIGADSVSFLPIESLRACVDNPDDFCYACFSGRYPFEVKDQSRRRKN
jgi:amidophosphoribosyltransferase